jgi:hypothetical protein
MPDAVPLRVQARQIRPRRPIPLNKMSFWLATGIAVGFQLYDMYLLYLEGHSILLLFSSVLFLVLLFCIYRKCT